MSDVSNLPPLVPEHAPTVVKVLLLPLTLPLAILFILLDGLVDVANRMWEVLRGY